VGGVALVRNFCSYCIKNKKKVGLVQGKDLVIGGEKEKKP
jgi:hypothetical protein